MNEIHSDSLRDASYSSMGLNADWESDVTDVDERKDLDTKQGSIERAIEPPADPPIRQDAKINSNMIDSNPELDFNALSAQPDPNASFVDFKPDLNTLATDKHDKPVSLLDVLSGRQSKKKKKQKFENLRRDHEVIELERRVFKNISKSGSALDVLKKPDVISIDNDDVVIEDEKVSKSSMNRILESKICGDVKKTAPRDIFKTFKKEHFVTLRLKPEALSDIKKYDNPLKSKGNGAGTVTDFFAKRNQVFHETQPFKRKSPISKLKELPLPTLTRSELHVKNEEDIVGHCSNLDSLFKPRQYRHYDLDDHDLSFLQEEKKPVSHQTLSKKIDFESIDSIKQSVPDNPQLRHILNYLNVQASGELWVELFKPKSTSQVLISPEYQAKLSSWVSETFDKLEHENLKQPRKFKRKKKDMDDFIVDDLEEQDEIPLLIIQGSVGSCKTSSVYAAIAELNGYVYEINSGQPRGKKDLYNSLKEFATTHLVHKHESRKFQKGIALFEDVEVLFEQDKNFWNMVQDIMSISRKPIIITCDDLAYVPSNIIEIAELNSAIIKLDDDPVPRSLFSQYASLCCLSQGFDVSDEILNSVLDECHNGVSFDLRKYLMHLQFICQDAPSKITKINKTESHPQESSLLSVALESDISSHGDIIETNSWSPIKHDNFHNELTSVYQIPNSSMLHLPTQAPETNIGRYLTKDLLQPEPKFTFNQLQKLSSEFLGSRAKKLPKMLLNMDFTMRVTRSFNSSPEPIEAVASDSSLAYISRMPFITEIFPYERNWYSFQIALDHLERQNKEVSIKRFLRYRDFGYLPKDFLATIAYNSQNILSSH